MLRVALVGALVNERARFENAHFATPVDWVTTPGEYTGVDLSLGLSVDAQHWSALVPKGCPTASWEKLPDHSGFDSKLQVTLEDVYGFVVGYTDAMHDVCRRIRAMAHPMARVVSMRALIAGETGVGKELVARAIHRLGPAPDSPFVAINCGALPPGLAASELFGHVRGSFTGAVSDREGAFGRAGNGVVFLDEIGDMPVDLQSHLLRVLEVQTFGPVGSDEPRKLTAQVLAATHRELPAGIEGGSFRADLYFRLAQLVIQVPSLLERAPDIELLASSFWRKAKLQGPVDPDLLAALAERAWPGNVRELRSAIERFVVLRAASAGSAASIAAQAIGAAPAETPVRQVRGTKLAHLQSGLERDLLIAVMRRTNWKTSDAARELGVTQRTVYNLLQRHGVKRPR